MEWTGTEHVKNALEGIRNGAGSLKLGAPF
jgi:hypothetical protein